MSGYFNVYDIGEKDLDRRNDQQNTRQIFKVVEQRIVKRL
jgi:hypothetical protein